METREILGVVALGALWLNSLLVFAAALRQAASVRVIRNRLREALASRELVHGEVVSAEGEAFAVRRIAQTGRAMTVKGPERILFTDGLQSFEVLGGELKSADGVVEVAPAVPGLSEVWTSQAREQEASASGHETFEAAFGSASTNKGFRREVAIEVRVGDRVWVAGARTGDRLEATDTRPLLVSMVDPVAWCGSRILAAYGFVAGAGVFLGAFTTLALWPPRFGTFSTIGGALCLAYFILVQPAGVSLRNRVLPPSRRLVGGLWRRATS